MARVQLIAIAASILFLIYIGWLIIKGKLREEYAIVWIICTVLLITFSFWREGLEVVSKAMGIVEAPNMVFTAALFAVFIYLLHLSITVSRLQQQNKTLAQDIALMKSREKKENDKK